MPQILRALELAQQGGFASASEVLGRFEHGTSAISLVAVANLYRITNQWERFLAWESQHRQSIERHPGMLPIMLRARGETGDVPGLVECYDRHRHQIGRMSPAASRDMCRLMLFAFCGKRPAIERLFSGSLAVSPAPVQAFWLATADLVAGDKSARSQFEELLPAADPMLRRAIERRLTQILPPTSLLPSLEGVVDGIVSDQSHEETFGLRRSFFSSRACATQVLLVLNVLMFALEYYMGGGEDGDVLYRLGALCPPAVRAGEWWRLLSACFLHFGPMHLALNMFGLWLLGPFVEFALGFRRFVFLYLLAGTGSMAAGCVFGFRAGAESLAVGASGCIMGLVGATAALMLRGWVRERADAAKRRLLLMLTLIIMEIVFDSMVPDVSMTAHLSGAIIGFVAAMFLQDRLRPRVA